MFTQIKSYIDLGDLVFLLTWGLVFWLSLYILQSASESILARQPLVVILFLSYLLCFILATRDEPLWQISLGWRRFFFIFQLVPAFVLNVLVPVDFLPILTIMWVALLPFFTSFLRSIIIGLLVVAVWFTVSSYVKEQNLFFSALLYGSFHLFAIYAHTQARREKEAREALQAKHMELRATQHLLSEASKQSERTRIARDLHDLLGHHLTALTINLQIAGRLTEGEAKQHVENSHQIAKLLLSDVRDAVTRLRENQSFNLKHAVELLLERVPQIKVELEMDDNFRVESLDTAHTILRCIQEAITNSLKHSRAKHIYIQVHDEQGHAKLEISDDGELGKNWQEGNGILGMRERVTGCSGTLSLEADQGHLKYLIQLPLSV